VPTQMSTKLRRSDRVAYHHHYAAAQRRTNCEFWSVGEVANAYRSGRIGEAGLVEELSKRSYKALAEPGVASNSRLPSGREANL
jgi:hypothetical protein